MGETTAQEIKELILSKITINLAQTVKDSLSASTPHKFDYATAETIALNRIVNEYVTNWGNEDALANWLDELQPGALDEAAALICRQLAQLGRVPNGPLVREHAYYWPTNLIN